ncbi:hypothetical protein AMATHDRAFT_59176 [Amanita thiersii Skay4041]|uniref:Arginyl-tRNA--protein transferase 1 n=1 Tax=Amanita thiersii Skay4041 TaxID=703135 RepID=A0A2A9NQ33_9AGAR|nr:hypothetical protein AMATHDRAFT_59176 [Amanita thiersii Skay4041]
MPEPLSMGYPMGRSASTCGYCGPQGERSPARSNYISASLDSLQLSCKVYQQMIDRGWRRSGTWCYKPELRYSCCPQYTIRLHATEFKPSKSQRKLINRWNRYVLQGKPEEVMDMSTNPGVKAVPRAKTSSFSLTSAIHASEVGFHSEDSPAHCFEVIIEPSSYSSEKYALYERYQEQVHHDTHNSSSGFKRFLVHSPLTREPIPYPSSPPSHLPTDYGSYHQLYKLDGELIAMAVLDVLPFCVSSVYFMYDSRWEGFSLGKLSAIREITLVQEMREAGAPEMEFLYMGFYIHSCQKMRYKGQYSPSYLVDPVTCHWYPYKDCASLLDKYRYACFSDPSSSILGPAEPDDESYPPIGEETMENVRVRLTDCGKSIVIPIFMTNVMNFNELRREVEDCVRGLGAQLSKEVILTFDE